MYTATKLLYKQYPDYIQHLNSLDDESKYLRFGTAMSADAILAFYKIINNSLHKHTLFGVYDATVLVGVGHIAQSGLRNSDPIELALSVLPSYQKQGIGKLLLARCIAYAQESGFTSGTMMCLTTNVAIRKLCIAQVISLRTENNETHASFVFPQPASQFVITNERRDLNSNTIVTA